MCVYCTNEYSDIDCRYKNKASQNLTFHLSISDIETETDWSCLLIFNEGVKVTVKNFE